MVIHGSWLVADRAVPGYTNDTSTVSLPLAVLKFLVRGATADAADGEDVVETVGVAGDEIGRQSDSTLTNRPSATHHDAESAVGGLRS